MVFTEPVTREDESLWTTIYRNIETSRNLETTSGQLVAPGLPPSSGALTTDSPTDFHMTLKNDPSKADSEQPTAPSPTEAQVNKFQLSLQTSWSTGSMKSTGSSESLTGRRNSVSSIDSSPSGSKTTDTIGITAPSTPKPQRRQSTGSPTHRSDIPRVDSSMTSPGSQPLPAAPRRMHKSQGSQDFSSLSSPSESPPVEERTCFPGSPDSWGSLPVNTPPLQDNFCSDCPSRSDFP